MNQPLKRGLSAALVVVVFIVLLCLCSSNATNQGADTRPSLIVRFMASTMRSVGFRSAWVREIQWRDMEWRMVHERRRVSD